MFLDNTESLLLVGGAGNDTYQFDADNALGLISLDEILGGKDTLDFSLTDTLGISINLALATTQVVNVNLSLILKSGGTFDNVIGGAGNDTITGNALANVLRGGDGNDTQDGGAGNDTYVFDADTNLGIETLADPVGVDTISFAATSANVDFSLGTTTPQSVNGGLLIVTLASATTFDNLTGGDGNDTLTGNAGINILIGGAGDDTLSGDAGNDIYLFDADTPLGSDTLTDAVGTETISFSATSAEIVFSLASSAPQCNNG